VPESVRRLCNTVCRDDEKNLKRFEKREEKLKKLLEQKNWAIDELQEEIEVWENSGRSWLRWKEETKQGKLYRLKQRKYTSR